MSHSQSYTAIVLKTYDVGEADRYCILFTRERGRVAARASGARKLKSRLGGSLLPFQLLRVELKETDSGFIVAGADAGVREERLCSDLKSFSQAVQGVDLLLSLVSEEEPLPEIFEATAAFLRACGRSSPHLVLAYTLRLIHLMGLLPDPDDMTSLVELSDHDIAFLAASLKPGSHLPVLPSARMLQRLCTMLLEGQLSSALKSTDVVAGMEM